MILRKSGHRKPLSLQKYWPALAFPQKKSQRLGLPINAKQRLFGRENQEIRSPTLSYGRIAGQQRYAKNSKMQATSRFFKKRQAFFSTPIFPEQKSAGCSNKFLERCCAPNGVSWLLELSILGYYGN